MSLFWRHVYIEHNQSVEYFAHFFTTCQALNTIASYEYQKNEHIQQRNLFKCQTSTFYFSTYRPNLFKHILSHTPVRPYERLDCCDHCISRRNNTSARSFLSTTLLCTSKLLAPDTYSWSCKTLVTIYWMHFRVNGLWPKSLCSQETNNITLFLTWCFQW